MGLGGGVWSLSGGGFGGDLGLGLGLGGLGLLVGMEGGGEDGASGGGGGEGGEGAGGRGEGGRGGDGGMGPRQHVPSSPVEMPWSARYPLRSVTGSRTSNGSLGETGFACMCGHIV